MPKEIEEREAGHLILSQIEMFNEASVLFENVISVSIHKGIDECVESFADKNDWGGKYEFYTEDCWLAPKQWITNPGEDSPEYKAWFCVDCVSGPDDSWTALFCQAGSQGGEAGFSFRIDPACFGGKNAWKACAKQIPQEDIVELEKLGFKKQGDGSFFLPVYLDNQLLAQSWQEFGEFTHDDESFDPLREALEKLKQAVQIFDQIMKGCPTVAPTKG